MNSAELQAIRNHYRSNLERGLDPVAAVDWGSAASQEARFAVLAEIYEHDTSQSILDIGCGLGGFYRYLQNRGHRPHYSGLDICPEMIHALCANHPEVAGITHNIIAAPLAGSWDLVVSSGIFNRIGSDDEHYTRAMIEAMWQLSTKSVAWNMLSTRAEPGGIAPTTRLNNPEQWLAFARQLDPAAQLRHDYLGHDFTIILRK